MILKDSCWKLKFCSPESADTSSFGVEDGDVILLATDGVFDNVPDQLLVTEMRKVEGERDPTKIQGVANTIAWMARSLAFDGAFMSPFAQSARENGIDAIGKFVYLSFPFLYAKVLRNWWVFFK